MAMAVLETSVELTGGRDYDWSKLFSGQLGMQIRTYEVTDCSNCTDVQLSAVTMIMAGFSKQSRHRDRYRAGSCEFHDREKRSNLRDISEIIHTAGIWSLVTDASEGLQFKLFAHRVQRQNLV